MNRIETQGDTMAETDPPPRYPGSARNFVGLYANVAVFAGWLGGACFYFPGAIAFMLVCAVIAPVLAVAALVMGPGVNRFAALLALAFYAAFYIPNWRFLWSLVAN